MSNLDHDATSISVAEAERRNAFLASPVGRLRTFGCERRVPTSVPFVYRDETLWIVAPSAALAGAEATKFCADLKRDYGWPRIGEV